MNNSDRLKMAYKQIASLKTDKKELEEFTKEKAIDIENKAIEKLGGIATFVEKGINRKLEEQHKEVVKNISNELKTHNYSVLDVVNNLAVKTDNSNNGVNKKVKSVADKMDLVSELLENIVNPKEKSFLKSKTLWTNALMVGGALITKKTGFNISPELFTIALAGVNIILRKVTKSAIKWW